MVIPYFSSLSGRPRDTIVFALIRTVCITLLGWLADDWISRNVVSGRNCNQQEWLQAGSSSAVSRNYDELEHRQRSYVKTEMRQLIT